MENTLKLLQEWDKEIKKVNDKYDDAPACDFTAARALLKSSGLALAREQLRLALTQDGIKGVFLNGIT